MSNYVYAVMMDNSNDELFVEKMRRTEYDRLMRLSDGTVVIPIDEAMFYEDAVEIAKSEAKLCHITYNSSRDNIPERCKKIER